MKTPRDTWRKLIWWQKSLVVAAICTALYAAFGFLLLPYIARYIVVEKVSPALNRQISVGEIRFNPFALTADISGFSIADRDGAGEFVAFDALHADLELSSIPRLSLVVRNVSLEGPRIHIRLDENGQTNFSDLTGGPKEPSPQAPEEPMLLPVIVEPFTVGNGTLTFDDQARGVSHVVDLINFELPRFSSRKKDWETFMTPTLSFRVNGAPFNLEGRTIPFSNSLKTEFDLNVVDLGLPQYWAYAMASKDLQLSRGNLSLETKLAFEQHEDTLPTFSIQGTITGSDIELTDNGEPVLTAAKTQVVMDDISILNLRLGMQSVDLTSPYVKLVRDRKGDLNWLKYFSKPATVEGGEAIAASAPGDANATADVPNATTTAAHGNATLPQMPGNATAGASADTSNATAALPEGNATQGDEAAGMALLLQIPKLKLTDGRILYRDETLKAPFTKEVASLDMTVTDLSTAANATSQASLEALTAAGENITANATFSIFPTRVTARVEARNLDIPSYAPFYGDALPMTLASAKADAAIVLTMDGPDLSPRLEDSRVTVRELTLKAPGDAGQVRLGRAAVDRIFVDLAAREVRTGLLTLSDAAVATGVDGDGRATIVDALAAPPKSSPPAPKPDGNATAAGPAWRVASAGAEVTGIELLPAGYKAAPLRLESLKVGPVDVDTGAMAVNVGPVDLALGLDVVREKSGDIDLARLFAPAPSAAKAPAKAPAPKSQPSPWTVAVERFSISGTKVAFTDQTLPRPSRVDVDQISFTTKNLSTDLDKAIPLELSCRIEESGTVKASGDIVPSTLVTRGTATLSRIPLSLASAYVADAAAVDIPAGRLGGRLNWRMGGKGREQITGSLNVDGLRITEARSRAEIAGFRALGLEQVTLQLSPLALSIGTVNLLEPRASFVIDGQGRTTLDRIVPSAKKPAAGKAAKKDSSDGLKTLDIASFAMKQGRFTFTDQTLSPQFASVISPVDLNVRGISLDPQKKADIELSAVIDGTAPINATGWVSPLKDPVEANSTVTLRNLDLVALSPYSAKFIAYPVAQGQLDWDIDLSTQGSNLAMRNAIKARQLELGDKVESPDAVDAPVKLGLALLRDMSGNIAINLPVKGDLNDPKFSIGGIVMQAFLGLIIKAVASPFSLLASLVPEGAADLSKLAFPPGLATPAQESMDSITSLADIMKQRPGISISVVGHADPAADRQAMADSQFLRKLQVVKYDGLSRKEREGVVLEELKITDEEYADVLWEAYKEEPVEKKKNFLGIHEDVPREEQEAKLRELIRVTDEDLVRLAASRAEFVKNRLVQELGVEAGRVFMGGTGPQSLSGAHEVTVEIRK